MYDHKAVTGVYMLLDNLSILPDASEMRNIWKKSPFKRGKYIEDYYAATDYKTWHHIGRENNGFFPVIDFSDGQTVISMKSLDLNAGSYSSYAGIKNVINDYAEILDSSDIKINNQSCKSKILEIIVPANSENIQKLNEVIADISEEYNIDFKVKELIVNYE